MSASGPLLLEHTMPTIRPATPDDIPDLIALIAALARHHDDEASVTTATLTRDAFGANRFLHILIAESAGQPVGYAALLSLARLQYGQRGMDLHHLFVTDRCRGQGIGKQLLQAALNFSRDLDASYVVVGTHPENRKAQDFYLKCGFVGRNHAVPGFSYDLTKDGVM